MFERIRRARSRRDYQRQPAHDFLFDRRSHQTPCDPRRAEASHTLVVVGDPSERSRRYQQTDLAELRISRADVPALTITADPGLSVAVTGSERPDWSLRFCAQGRGGSDEEARERLREISMVRTGATVSLIAPHLGGGYYRGDLVVEAPAEAPLTIHASYAAVRLRDMKGPVRITASHARAQILDTVGQVDA